MIRQCCECKRIYENGSWVHPLPGDLDDEEITHGYCDICTEDLRRKAFESCRESDVAGG